MENFQTEVSDSGFSLEKIMDPDRDPGCLESLDPVRAERLDPDPVNTGSETLPTRRHMILIILMKTIIVRSAGLA